MKQYIPKSGKFDFKSLTQADFKDPGRIEIPKGYGPNYKYICEPDTRDFLSETHEKHNYKSLSK